MVVRVNSLIAGLTIGILLTLALLILSSYQLDRIIVVLHADGTNYFPDMRVLKNAKVDSMTKRLDAAIDHPDHHLEIGGNHQIQRSELLEGKQVSSDLHSSSTEIDGTSKNGLSYKGQENIGHVYPIMDAPVILPKVLALYFPQYHKDPLNDRLWGNGFTDWDNLRDAPERNKKGYKIIRPTTLGYYDLRNKTIRQEQGNLARNFGVDGFVYHHYWFYDDTHPGPTLAAPLEDMLLDGEPNISFCLHWVAENWTTTWHRQTGNETTGKERRNSILQQQFFPNDPLHPNITIHYQWLSQFFHHKNYIKVRGMPLFMIYRVSPGIHSVIKRLKELAIQDGFPGLHCPLGQYTTSDELTEFGRGRGQNESLEGENAIFDRLTHYPFPYDWTRRESFRAPTWCLKQEKVGKPHGHEIFGLVTSFDNTPRRELKQARIWISYGGESSRLAWFRRSLWATLYYHACCFSEGGTDEFVLVNAWNEWAEGMAMEPSDVYGLFFLRLLKSTKERFSSCSNALRKKR
jgi:Glycosyltransferase WbsX